MNDVPAKRPHLAPTIAIVVSCVGLLSACGLGARNHYVPPPLPPPASPISVSTHLLTFDPIPVGTTSLAKVLTLTNTSSQAIAVDAIRVSFTDSFSRTTDCGHQILAGQSCTVSVLFNPQLPRPRMAQIDIVSRGFAVVTILLRGTGTPPPPPASNTPPS